MLHTIAAGAGVSPGALELGADRTFHVALIVPLQGPLGLIGPSSELCAQLAAKEINESGGILGRELRLHIVDGGVAPQAIAAEVDTLVTLGLVQAVVGAHTSAVRQAVVARVAGRVPYVYTSVYEGGEVSPGVFLTGETPTRQLLPGMRLLAEQHHVRRWCIVGNDYVWPRKTASMARHYARHSTAVITDEIYVPVGSVDFGHVIKRVERSRADAVLVLLVGSDAVHFHRAFARRGLHDQLRRLTTLMDENMLVAAGACSTAGLFATAGYFDALATPDRLDFAARYARQFGVDGPLVGTLGESCYEGLRLLDALVRQARSPDVQAMTAAADTVHYEGARGLIPLKQRHAVQPIYLAEANAIEFDVIARLA